MSRVYKTSRARAGILSWTKLFHPDEVRLDERSVKVEKKNMMGLKGSSDEVTYDRIASVRLSQGLVSGDIVIETSGGSEADLEIRGFRKEVAEKLKDDLSDRLPRKGRRK
ncbi:PH domain-containing protein [Salisediminibacterium selenitireducens]|uniref:YdbS-like PH domain-containing protein n=1 Tax=Bacillus selenitireducens (strain ATCC 700615 / DSM 15326 / MLS10) TaxID=439292 RepID=D6XWG5_BACIE|nr:PH domain-containing protein [Salisediminibacterium selenitireducens]ADH97807.1 hypothetical protein Bsel_0265 [[Bacillus] selenitireducens MLS10]